MNNREIVLHAVDLFLDQCPKIVNPQTEQIHQDFYLLALAASKRHHGVKLSNRQMTMELEAFARLRGLGFIWKVKS